MPEAEFDFDVEELPEGGELRETIEQEEPAGRRARRPRKSRATPRRSKAERLASVGESLANSLTEFGAVVSFGSPTGGAFWVSRAERNAALILRLAERNPRLLKLLEKSETYTLFVELGAFVAGMGIAVAIDFGRMPSDNFLAETLGVTDAYKVAHPEVESVAQNEGGESPGEHSGGFLSRASAGA